MTLPTLDKTWQISSNNVVAAQGTALATNKRILRTIKNLLLAFATQPWTTRYSCSSTVAGAAGDGVDRWTTDADLVWNAAGSAHSWYVFRQTGVGATFEVLISLEGAAANGNTLTCYMSPSATFTGGTTTARPTATDEVPIRVSAAWGGTGSADSGVIVDAWQSTDGQCTRVVVCDTSTACTFMLFDKPKNPITGWTNPCVGIWLGQSAVNTPTYSSDIGAAIINLRISATNTTAFMTQEAFGPPAAGATAIGIAAIGANEVSGDFPILPIGIWCNTAPLRGRQGEFFDLWLGYNTLGVGDTYPNDATRQFVQLAAAIHPWDGTLPVVA